MKTNNPKETEWVDIEIPETLNFKYEVGIAEAGMIYYKNNKPILSVPKDQAEKAKRYVEELSKRKI